MNAMQSWELEARESLRDLVARYNDAGDAGRLDLMLDLFLPDAILEVPPERVCRGRESIRHLFAGAAAGSAGARPVRALRHFTSTLVLDLESPERARGRCYYAVLTEAGLDHWGRYRDEYARGGDGWRFARRAVRVDGLVPGGWGERGLARLAHET